MALAPSPLFRDPVEDGAADPTLVWNPHERAWWMVYTNRRTTAPFEDGLAWLFGGSLGVASSTDGVRWDYRGTLTGLEVEWGLNTFWAPEIVEHAGTFHMFVSYIRGIPARVGPRHGDAALHEPRPRALDARGGRAAGRGPGHRRVRAPAARRRLADVVQGRGRRWPHVRRGQPRPDVVDGPRARARHPGGHEGPNVFRLGGWYWLVVDTWHGQSAYRSHDLDVWEPAGQVLAGEIGQRFARTDDVGPGLHGDVVSDGERAWIFYFTHPDRTEQTHPTAVSRRSSVLVAELTVVDGRLHCDRDADVDVDLPVPGV